MSQQQLGADAMAFIKELEKEPWKLNQVSLHEPTIPDLLQAIAELKEREREAIRAHLLLEQENTIIRAHVTYLETELATLRARGS